ncbi:MAG TPA: RNA polymerase sigma factor [Steroidobacter sp.]|uniref:RNA polymerase sigma factor n=1 Tax=Steroidobacter sp. TaxID=1978227 RepID=UPI002ED84E42
MIQSSEETHTRDGGPIAVEQTGAAAESDRMDDHGRAYFTALFQKYRSSLFRYLTGLVTSPDDAAELVQESYARLLQHEDVTQLEAVSRTYLFQIATNLARDHYRRRTTRHSSAHLDVDAIEITDESAGPEHNLVWDSTIESIKEGIKELPTMTRRIFLLSRFRGKTYPQIALLLGVSTRTVERKMSEAMQVLAARLRERP